MHKYKGKFSVLMPAYNEAHHIIHNIRETKKVFEELECNYEIILIDDGSSDNTAKIAEEVYKDDPCVIIKETPQNLGKGNALKYGFKFCSGEVVVFLDADLDLHPRQIEILYNIMKENRADIVIGSKRHPASVLKYPKRRKIMSYAYNFFVRVLFVTNIKDTQTGIKVFKKEVLDVLFSKILVKKFAFDVELLMVAHHYGYKIVDAPIKLDFCRGHRFGRMKMKDLYYTWMDTLAIFYRMYILKHYKP